jgi:hypothetical protein
MRGVVRAGEALSAQVVVRRGGPIWSAVRWLWVAFAAIVLQDPDAPLPSGPTVDVVVTRRVDGKELIRIRKDTEPQAEELLAEVSRQLENLSVDEFCARWGAPRTGAQ